ncbi:hypothetical protein D3C73_1596350 [compost metagenome]
MPQLAEPVRSVHARRFIQLRIDAGQCRQEYDRAPACFFPYDLSGNDRPKPFVAYKKIDLFSAEAHQQLVHQAAFRR